MTRKGENRKRKKGRIFNTNRLHSRCLLRAVSTVTLGRAQSTARTDTIGQIVQHVNRHLPVDAGIGDTDALEESGGTLGGHLLATLVDIRLDHDTDDSGLALAQLVGDLLRDDRLVEVVLLRVAVGAIHHEDLALLLGAEGLARTADTLAVVVRALVTAAQDDEAVLVTGGLGNGRETLLGHA